MRGLQQFTEIIEGVQFIRHYSTDIDEVRVASKPALFLPEPISHKQFVFTFNIEGDQRFHKVSFEVTWDTEYTGVIQEFYKRVDKLGIVVTGIICAEERLQFAFMLI